MAKGLLVKFLMDSVYMEFQSKKENRPIFEDREFVEIRPIGSNSTMVREEVTDVHRDRWPDEYKRFKDGAADVVTGTPLKEWPFMRPAQIKMLNFYNVFTVEQLSDLTDNTIQAIGMGTREWVKQAKSYLERAKTSVDAMRIVEDNKRLSNELDDVRIQLAELRSQQPKRGRPPKHIEGEAAASP